MCPLYSLSLQNLVKILNSTINEHFDGKSEKI